MGLSSKDETVTKPSRKHNKNIINYSFNCNDKCIIHLLTCNKCKFHYEGKAVDDFRLRWNKEITCERNMHATTLIW